jgi:hypothetical protein
MLTLTHTTPDLTQFQGPECAYKPSTCRLCGSADDLFGLWWEHELDTLCGPCFAHTMKTLKTIKIQRWYV